MRHCILIFLITLSFSAHAQWTVETVPNEKVNANNLVSNPDSVLQYATVQALNQQLRDLEAKTTVQVAVVVLNSIGSADIFDFAQRLFTTWGIGQASNDNGLLVLMVMDQRTVRFHTGYGLEGILPDVICKRIEVQHMVPFFKDGKYDDGLSAGIAEVIRVVSDPQYAEEVMGSALRESSAWEVFFPTISILGAFALLIVFMVNRKKFSDSSKPTTTAYQGMRQSRVAWLTEFGIVPLVIVLVFNFSPLVSPILETCLALYCWFLVTLIHRRMRMGGVVRRMLEGKRYKHIVDFFEEYRVGWIVWAIFFPIPFLPLYFQYRGRIRYFRDHPRDCKNCGRPVHKLDEQSDDAHLSKEKVFEEGLKSADYDIWMCDGCGTYFELMYVNRFSKYKHCPKCKTKAQYLKSNRTIKSPTTSSTGKGEKTHECKFCNHQVVTTYTIAKLSDSSSSSGGGSSSSGGSFGGGSSGGGGASSSW